MNWADTSKYTPGFRTYETADEEKPGNQYLIHRKIDGTGLWKLFFTERPGQANRIIYTGDTLKECQDYAETYRWAT